MWFLTCDGTLLGDHPVWLRPGTQHLLGRTTPRYEGDQIRYIDDKSVSRKHLMIQIADVKPGDSKHAHNRSKITITDSSKTGTTINGEKLLKDVKVITSDIEFKVGLAKPTFQIVWRPVVLAFTNLPGRLKKKDDPLEEYRISLEQADIKLLPDYIANTTTHVIAKGRNNPTCLQALAQGRWAVQHAWLDALIEVMTRSDGSPSKLQLNFGAWPAEKDYITASGGEPVVRPDEMLLPDSRRGDAFSGLTFVFMTEKQYDSLSPVVSAAGGKSLLCEVEIGSTRAIVFVDSIKKHFIDSKTGFAKVDALKKVAIVRGESKDDMDWWTKFCDDVDAMLRHRCMAQKDFLDAILTLDTSALCAGDKDDAMAVDAPVESQNSAPTPSAGKYRKFAAQSRFKGFDDFDPSQIAANSESEPEEIQPDTPVSDHESRKRPATSMSDVLDEHLPGMRDMKRQRLGTTTKPDNEVIPKPAKSKAKAIDVKAQLVEQRKREEEERQLAEEALQNQLDGLTVEDLKKLAQHKEFDVDLSHRQAAGEANGQGRDWDAAWNGRKNFKAFTRNGQVVPSRQHRIMVALEPIPRKPDPFTEEYFLESVSTQSRRANVDLNQRSLTPASNGSVPTSAQRKRSLPESQRNEAAKRARFNNVMLDQDDDDDEHRFERKRF